MSVGVVCFSPTGTTRTVCIEVARGLGDAEPTLFDVTLPEGREAVLNEADDLVLAFDQVVVGVPVYLGKIPPLPAEVLSRVQGRGRRVSAVAVYGNRDFGVALRRLCETLVSRGFDLASAGAFIGEHSYSAIIPVAVARPDEADLEAARRFGASSARVVGTLSPGQVEEQLDLFSRSESFAGLHPRFSRRSCIECGDCHAVCPTGIIAEGTGEYACTDHKRRCIGCMACVRACPAEGRTLSVGWLDRLMVRVVLRNAARLRQEPRVFLPRQILEAAAPF